jgi:uncharacterized protein (TIGR02270 family)
LTVHPYSPTGFQRSVPAGDVELLCAVHVTTCVSMANHPSKRSDPPAKSSAKPAPRIIREVVMQHAEDASFLWLLRHAALSQPHYSLADLSKLDNRVEAHLDGLRIAGESGWNVVQQTLSFEESCDLFAAGSLAFESGNRDWIDFVLESAAKKPENASGVISSLGWLPYEQARPHIQTLVSSRLPTSRAVGIAASAIHRVDPGKILGEAIGDSNPLVRTRALRAVGELGRVDLLPRMRTSLADPDQSARFAAAWSTALLSPNLDALGVLRTIAESPGPFSTEALQTTIRRMDLAGAKAWQAWFSRRKEGLRTAIAAAGALGDPEYVPWLIEQMKVPLQARIAGEAFTTITGIDLAYDDLEKNAPANFEAGPTENPEDENVDMDPDEHLPWPDPELIHKWWTKSQTRFQRGTRYILGKPMMIDWLRHVLRIGRQRQRAAAALELAIRQPGQPLFEVRAPGFRQEQKLGSNLNL